TALEDAADDIERYLVERHAEDGERHDRPRPHRIDVGYGVGRSDPAEIIGVVDHRHEEIGGGDDAKTIIDLPHRGIIAGLGADEELAIGLGGGLSGEKLL